MTNAAGEVVEALNDIWRDDDHERLCQGREYSCTCGFDDRTEATAQRAAALITTLERQLATAREALDMAEKRIVEFGW